MLSSIISELTIFALFIIGYYFSLFADYSNWVFFFLPIMIISESIMVFTTFALVYQVKFKKLAPIQFEET
jgi:hypothetical protein